MGIRAWLTRLFEPYAGECSLLTKRALGLYAEGRLTEAHETAARLAALAPHDRLALDLVHRIRTDIALNRHSEHLADLSRQLRWLNSSVAQDYVARILRDPKFDDPLRLERHGYSVASQNEEDGMLAEVFRRIGESNRVFFEFGVGNGLQNNTLCCLLRGWSGYWIEIHPAKVEFIRNRFATPIRNGRLVLDATPITAENINEVARRLGVPGEIDLLSVDIDGNDYHVFQALQEVRARVVVLEYNPLYPPPMSVVTAYDADYTFREETYVGASLQSLTDLAEKKGYKLVGCSVSGINAIFVRADLASNKFSTPATAEHFYHGPRYQLSFSGGFGWGPRSNFSKFHVPNFDR